MKTYALLMLLAVGAPCALAIYCYRPNIDCPGNDIRSFKTDVDACQAACDAEPRCKSIQHHKGKCYLKNKACKSGDVVAKMNANDYVKYDGKCGQSIYASPRNKYCHRENTDCKGRDIATLHTSGVKQCQTICDFIKDCKSLQVLEGGKCWLKNYRCQNTELEPKNGGSDYVKITDEEATCEKYNPRHRYCPRPDMDCKGNDIKTLSWVKSLAECQTFCSLNKQCKSIQYKESKCWLKDKVCELDELSSKVGFTDWVRVKKGASCDKFKAVGKSRFCARANKDCRGNDIEDATFDTVEQCQDLCSYRTDCKSIQFIGKKCWLKNHACKEDELRDYEGASDFVRIRKAHDCKKQLAKLAK